MRAAGTWIFGCILSIAMPAMASPTGASASPSISDQIQHLSDRTPSERSAAYEALRLSADPNLRPALLEAAHRSPSPQIRERTAKLLCNLPWSKPEDPPNLQFKLRSYRTPSVEERIRVLGELATTQHQAVPVLIRLLAEDPSDDVRWAIVATVRTIDGSNDALRKINPPPDDAPALAAAGWGWEATDPDKAAQYFRQSIQLAVTQGADDHGEIENILTKVLIPRAINHGQSAELIDLWRTQLWYTDVSPEQSVPEFFSQYAQHGVQSGFDEDAKTFASFMRQPEMMYVIGKIFASRGERLAAVATYASALQATGSVEERKRVAGFLIHNGWHELALAQLHQALAEPTPEPANRAELYTMLGACEHGLDHPLEAADDFDHAVQLVRAIGNPNADNFSRYYTSLADWLRLRDATDKKDEAKTEQLADKLFSAGYWRNKDLPSEGDILDMEIDLTRALKSMDRKSDAKQVFDSAFALMQRLSGPHDAQWMNNVAWLCARSGERLDEAYRYAHEAIRLAPANAANLDTAAEAAAALGKWDEAVELESAALKLQPGERFMMRQLERFKAKGK